jgi:hypothetical protein
MGGLRPKRWNSKAAPRIIRGAAFLFLKRDAESGGTASGRFFRLGGNSSPIFEVNQIFVEKPNRVSKQTYLSGAFDAIFHNSLIH